MFIDSHIHLEMYDSQEQQRIVSSLSEHGVRGLVAVSMNLQSCRRTQRLHDQYPREVFPAYGFHPEQPLPNDAELDELFAWMDQHRHEMVAVGEVGLPYYTRLEALQRANGAGQVEFSFKLEPYVVLLERFILVAKAWNKPIVLHAVYEDAVIVCDLLEKHSYNRAHFHWYKGEHKTTERMAQNGYFISFTPDLVYEPEIQQLARFYPME